MAGYEGGRLKGGYVLRMTPKWGREGVQQCMEQRMRSSMQPTLETKRESKCTFNANS